mgnify:CR=1 FL=1
MDSPFMTTVAIGLAKCGNRVARFEFSSLSVIPPSATNATSISAGSPPNPSIPERPVLVTFISTSSSSTSISSRAISVASSTVFPLNFLTLAILI